MPKKAKKPNLARKRLKEIKRKVTVDGKTFRKSFYGQTLEEALANHARFVAPPIELRVPEGSFAYVLVKKLVPLKSQKRPATREDIQRSARRLLGIRWLAVSQCKDIQAPELARALDELEAKPTLRNRNAVDRDTHPEIWKPLSARSINKARILALEVMELAAELDDDVRPINRKRVPVREEELQEFEVYTAGQMYRLYLASKNTICQAPILLHCFLGVPIRETLGTLAKDLKPSGVLDVANQLARKGTDPTSKLKTPYRKREMPLPEGLLAELRPFGFGSGHLCRGTQGQALKPDAIYRSLELVRMKAGLHRLTPHQLRHSFSSWLDENGCPSSVRLELMGQSKRQVKDRYNHASVEAKRLWLGKLWDAAVAEYEEWLRTAPIDAPTHAETGRKHARGEDNGRSSLTAEKVREIRTKLKTESVSSIAKFYGVDRGTIRSVRDGATWKEVI